MALGMWSRYLRFVTPQWTRSLNTEKCVNRVELLGRVGGDPQMRGTMERPVVIFSLATNSWVPTPQTGHSSLAESPDMDDTPEHEVGGDGDEMKSSGGTTTAAQWHRVCVFREHLRDLVYNNMWKGHRVLVHGRLSYSQVTDNFGRPVTLTSIIADNVIFLASSRKSEEATFEQDSAEL